MDVTLGAIEARGHFEHRDVVGCLEVAARARLHRRVSRRAQQRRQPAGLQVGAGADGDVGLPQFRDQAWARLDAVRVLFRGRGAERRNPVAAELSRERGPFRLAGKHLERGLYRCAGETDSHRKSDKRFFHGIGS